MPELPEVEVVRRGLERWVTGHIIDDVEVLHPRAVRRHIEGPTDFVARLKGRTLLTPRRRGKYFWLPLDSGESLLAHLGMSGQMLVTDAGAPRAGHLRVRLALGPSGPRRAEGEPESRRAEAEPRRAESEPQAQTGGAHELHFVDQRTFGHVMVSAGDPPEVIAHIAEDPLTPGFDPEDFHRRLRARRTEIKRALLDQSLISGVGNIYADEALWRARLHWARSTATLTRPKTLELVAAVQAVMREALDQGGTSFDSLYVNVNGESGYFERSLNAYGRRDEPCARCGTPIRRDPFMNRSSYSCPRCQRRPRIRS